MKVVGIGLNKTGTKTLGACLRFWGFKHISCDDAAFRLWCDGRIDEVLARYVAEHESFEDWPWPLIYREIDGAYPGTKFILTRRTDAERWFASLCRHAERTGEAHYRLRIYGHEMPHDHKREHLAFYEAHNRSVREHFRGRPDQLLEVCWEQGSGWSALAAFLRLPAPAVAFPHENSSARKAR